MSDNIVGLSLCCQASKMNPFLPGAFNERPIVTMGLSCHSDNKHRPVLSYSLRLRFCACSSSAIAQLLGAW
jgi:hypothetical protein